MLDKVKWKKEIVVVSAEELMEQGKPVDKATDFSAALAMAEASLQEPEEEEEIVEEEEVYDPGVFAPERWIIDINTCLYPTSRLILFHGIGQNFNFFKSWGPMFQTLNIALHSVCLPGRCHRINEPFCQVPDAAAYVVRVMEELHENGSNEEDQSKKGWKKVPTYLYGHCLGAIIAFEVAKTFTMQLSEKDHPNKDFFIQHLVVSSSRPPQLLYDGNKDRYAKKWTMQSDTDIMNRCAQLGGVPLLLRNKDRRDLLRLFVPVVRKDYCAYEKYDYIPIVRKSPDDRGSVDCPITSFATRDDKFVLDEEVALWEECTDYGTNPGQHNHSYFFLVGGHSWMNIKYKEKVIQDFLLSVCIGTDPEFLKPDMPSWEDEDGDEEYVREVETFYG